MSKKNYKGYKIDFTKNIGHGAFGGVYKGIHQETNRQVAIKRIQKNAEDGEAIGKAYVAEIRILKSIRNENIVEMIDTIITQNNYLIVQQFCNEGDLRKRMIKEKRFSEQQVVVFLEDILNGFTTLITNGIIHRDIKPENILISSSKLKIADFGFAKVVLSSSQLNKTNVGTPVYMSLQILKGQKYTSKCDVWSLGIVVYQLLFGKLPFFASTQVLLIKQIQKQLLEFPGDIQISNQMKSFIQGCLKVYEKQRFSWREIFSHPLFNKKFLNFINWFDQQQKRYKTIINNLIAHIQLNTINLQKLGLKLDLYDNSILTEHHFTNLFKLIDPNNKIIPDYNWIINKLDRNSDNAITLKQFKQFLHSTGIQQRQLLEDIKIQLIQRQISDNVELVLSKTLQKLKLKLKESNIDCETIFNSYANKETRIISEEKLKKLLRKIDDKLEFEDFKVWWKLFDQDSNGSVDFKDFENTFKKYVQ